MSDQLVIERPVVVDLTLAPVCVRREPKIAAGEDDVCPWKRTPDCPDDQTGCPHC